MTLKHILILPKSRAVVDMQPVA